MADFTQNHNHWVTHGLQVWPRRRGGASQGIRSDGCLPVTPCFRGTLVPHKETEPSSQLERDFSHTLLETGETKQLAVKKAGKQLLEELYAQQGNPQTVDLDSLTVESPVAPKSATQAAATPTDETPVQFDKTSTGKVKGVPYLSLNAIEVLESVASKGDVDKLTGLLMGSANAQTDEKIKLAVKKVGKDLLEKAYAHQGNPQKVNPDTLAVESKAATPEPRATAADKPIKLESVPDGLDASEVKYLELLANYGDVPAFDSAVNQLKAKKPNDWVAIAEASNNLLNQVYAKQDLKSAPQPIIQGLPTPDPDSPIKLENVPGVLKPSDVKKLEKMANEGVAYKLMSAAMGLAQKQNTKSDQAAVQKAGQELLNKLYAKQSGSKVVEVTPPEPEDAGSKPDAAVAAAPEPLTPTPAPAPAPTDETPIQLDAIPYRRTKRRPPHNYGQRRETRNSGQPGRRPTQQDDSRPCPGTNDRFKAASHSLCGKAVT